MEKNVRIEPLPERESAPKNKKQKPKNAKKSDHRHINSMGIVLYTQSHSLQSMLCEYCNICGKIRNFKIDSKNEECISPSGKVLYYSKFCTPQETLERYPDLPVYYYTEHVSPLCRAKNIKEFKLIDRNTISSIK